MKIDSDIAWQNYPGFCI